MEKGRQWLWRGQQRISEQASKDLLATQFNATFPFLLSLKHPAEFDSVDNLIPSFSGLECTSQGLFSHVSLFPWDSSDHTNVSFQQGQRMDPGSQIIRLFILSLSAGAVFWENSRVSCFQKSSLDHPYFSLSPNSSPSHPIFSKEGSVSPHPFTLLPLVS